MILVRHTAVASVEGVCYGQSDVPLKENWQEDADAVVLEVKQLLTRMGLQDHRLRIVHSPLGRCRLLAQHLFAAMAGLELQEDERLKEIDFGSWELRSWDELYGDPLAREWFERPLEIRPPGGESYDELRRRVLNFLKTVSSSDGVEDAIPCVVSHAGPIRVMLASSMGVSSFDGLSLPFGHGECRWLDVARG